MDRSGHDASRPAAEKPEAERHKDVIPACDGRRSFLTIAIALGAGAVSVLTPLVAGMLFLGGPLRRRAHSGSPDAGPPDAGSAGEGFIRLDATPASLPADGTPLQVRVRADRIDAWNHLPTQSVGTVWARLDEGGKVVVFSSICPHLGCCVEYRGAQRDFSCPCHNSAFALDGTRRNAIPPRDLDTLESKVVEDAIWVRYQKFRGGIAEKTPI